MLHAHGRSGTVDVTIALSMHLPGLAEQHVTAAARRPNPRERAVAVLRCCTETEDASQYLGEPDRACAGQPWAHPGHPDRSTGSEMVYNDVIEKIGMTIDAGGVVIIVAGAAIAFVASAVQLARRERVTSTGVSASGWAGPSCSAWSCWWPATSSVPSPPRPV
jgi:hypothetical protein